MGALKEMYAAFSRVDGTVYLLQSFKNYIQVRPSPSFIYYLAHLIVVQVTVSTIVRRALIRAGIDSVRKGAHLFRHTLATDLLRKGASLDEIGELLRHRSPNTTALYAKVDLAALRTLALPWPGGAQ